MTDRIASSLTAIVGRDGLRVAHEERVLYGYDATLGTHLPDYVVLPCTTQEVCDVVRIANEFGVVVTARGAGTSLSGGPLPLRGGIVLALNRMDRILDIDTANRRAIVEPGVVNIRLNSALAEKGYMYAPDPASQTVCTIGGNVAENAGGPRCLKYGVTFNHVLGLEMCLPDGQLVWLPADDWARPAYDLAGLMIGSEGTLGIVTKIACRVLPLPEATTTMLAVFDTVADAGRAVSGIIASGLLPATLEMMDRPIIAAVRMALDAGYPETAGAVLIVEIDGARVCMQRQVTDIQAVCRDNNSQEFEWASTPDERALLWRGRKGSLAAISNISPNTLCTDITVPRTQIPAMIEAVAAIAEKHGVTIGNLLHAGDGNLHPQVLFDASKPEQVELAERIDDEIVDLAVAHGGVLSGEHGIGCSKRRWMPLMFSAAALRAQQALKNLFDPDCLMNPGKVLPDQSEIPPMDAPELPAGPWESAASSIAEADDSGMLVPADEDAVADLMALAEREGQSVTICGAGSPQEGLAKGSKGISLSRLDRVVATEFANLTVTAQAGVRWSALQDQLRAGGQFVPIRPPWPNQVTVGGVVANASVGPDALLYGGVRDVVLGLRFVLPSGDVVACGSHCVKNVSGYALERMMIGSRGTLGAITEVTFRTRPIPEARQVVVSQCPVDGGEALARIGAAVLEAGVPLACFEAMTPVLARGAAERAGIDLALASEGWVLAFGIDGMGEETQQTAATVSSLVSGLGGPRIGAIEGAPCDDFWLGAMEFGEAQIRAHCLPSRIAELGSSVVDVSGWQSRLRLGMGTGSLTLWAGEPADAEDAAMRGLRERVAATGADLYSYTDGSRRLAGIASDSVEAELCRSLKRTYDPTGILPALV